MQDFDPKDPNSFREMGRKLSDFLDTEGRVLSEKEEKDISPILHSLDTMSYHFASEEILREGGEKVLSKAYDTQSDRFVVIARPRNPETDLQKEEFLREARLTSKLQHPNILPIHEMGIDKDGIPYFVMRYFRGEELSVIARKRIDGDQGYLKQYPLERMLEIFLRICDTVTYAHSCNVLHLDIKASNIMIGRYGQTILFDWGMAAVVNVKDENATETFDADTLNTLLHTGTLKGTPGYMAPEQIAEDGIESFATDIYALGAVLYHILTGTIPVHGAHAQEVIRNTRNGKVVCPRLRCPNLNIPSSLAAITLKALQLKPEDRYVDVQAIHDDITRYLRGYVPLAEQANPVKRFHLFVRRHSKVATVLFLSVFVLMAVIGTFYSREKLQSKRLEAARIDAVNNLNRFQEEKLVSDKLYADLKNFMAEVGVLGTLLTHDKLYSVVQRELEKNDLEFEYRKDLVWIRVMLELAYQNFNAARVLIEDYPEYQQYLSRYDELAQKFCDMKERDLDQLTDAQFTEFLNEAITRRHFEDVKILAYELHMTRSNAGTPESYLDVAIAILNVINDTEGWGGQVHLEPRGDGYHLDLSDAPYRIFNLSRMHPSRYDSILGRLNLVSLDISRSAATTFDVFRYLDKLDTIIALDMEPFEEKIFFRMLRQLSVKRIVLRDGIHFKKRINELRKTHEVILLPPGEPYTR